jgi:cell fate regulator YaaT (PSP1 superfamily)
MSKIFEVEFSGGRRSFYANPQEFPFVVGDLVIVQAEKGEDFGRVVNMGSLVDQRAGNREYPLILRKPSKKDMDQAEENQKLEREAFFDCRKRIEEHGLNMKLVDVEYQFDRNKITFYFTSEKRVDFRALVRDLASRYKTRIELRQIGVRDEAKRIGGVGVCGRRLCCEAFLREFEPVVTQFAKEQNLSLNPTKLSGSCGRLMCCLLYERDFYAEFAKQFPDAGSVIETAQGKKILKKIDVFEEQALLQLENGKEEKISLEELRRIVIEHEDKKRRKKTQKAEVHNGEEEINDEA